MTQPAEVLQIHADDNVCVATQALAAQTHLEVGGVSFTLTEDVRLGAKLAIRAIASGEKILKYGEPIGSATQDLQVGDYVHTHNMKSDYLPTFETGAFVEEQEIDD